MLDPEVMHSRFFIPKYSLSNPKWFAIFFSANAGAYLGSFFYLTLLTSPWAISSRAYQNIANTS